MTELDGTVALVTGASSGIGAATARELARRGAAVAIAARRKERLDALAADIEDGGGSALPIETDVTDQAQVTRVIQAIVDRFGRLDVVVNNAGVMLLGPIEDAPTEDWDRMIALNLQGLLYVAHAALPHLLTAAEDAPRHVADLVNISSVAGRVARKGAGVYNLTKHGVGAFSEALRQEVTAATCASRSSSPARSTPSCPTTSATRCASRRCAGSPRSSRSRPRTSPTRSRTSSRARATSRSTRC